MGNVLFPETAFAKESLISVALFLLELQTELSSLYLKRKNCGSLLSPWVDTTLSYSVFHFLTKC